VIASDGWSIYLDMCVILCTRSWNYQSVYCALLYL